MKLLGIDTSTLACTVAVRFGDKQVVRYAEQEREHTRLLLPMIREVLAETNLEVAELDAIVLGNGPGSFIGMRIATSVAQGLAYGAGVPIVAVSSLAVVAAAAAADGGVVAVTQDAHMQEVYLGLYRVDAHGVVALGDERLHAQARIVELDSLEGCVAAGAGWQRYPALLDANLERISRVSDAHYPGGEALLSLGAAAYDNGQSVDPAAVRPAYLRQQVAQPPAGNRS